MKSEITSGKITHDGTPREIHDLDEDFKFNYSAFFRKSDLNEVGTSLKKLSDIFYEKRRELQFIVFVGTIIGGAWQVLELSSISFEYIRFYSATQLLGDSLAIISFTLLTFFVLKSLNEGANKVPMFFSVSWVIVLSTFTFLLLYSNDQEASNRLLSVIIDLSSSSNLFVGAIIWFCIIKSFCILILKIAPIKKGLENLKENKYTKYSVVLLSPFATMALVLVISFVIHETLTTPDNLSNFDQLCEGKVAETCSVKYFNDRYIFVEDDQRIRVIGAPSVFQE